LPFLKVGANWVHFFYLFYLYFTSVVLKVGANWVHFKNMKKEDDNPVEDMVKKAGLHTVEDHYDDIVFRYKDTLHLPPPHFLVSF
jgi:hypothetical protein